jgi:hypothetical protein
MQEDPDITSINLTRVIFAGFNAPAANYYQTTFSNAVPKAAYERIAQKLFGKSYDQVLQEVFPLRKRMGRTLSRMWANAPGAPVAEGDILRVDRKKVHPGRMGDYLQVEQQYQPLRATQITAGKMKGWSSWAVVLPAGSDREFDAFTTHVVKDLESSLNWNQGGSAMAAKLEPPLNYSGLTTRAADTSKTTYGETRVVVAVFRRP